MKKTLNIIYTISIISYILIINIFFKNTLLNTSIYNYVINPIFFIIVFFIGLYINGDIISRYKKEEDKYKTVLVCSISYIIIYLLSGLFIGFQNSAYNHSFIGIIKNIWSILLIVILREYSRKTLLELSKSKINYILITILFITFTLTLNIPTEYLTNNESLFKYLCMIIIPGIFEGTLLTYLSLKGGLKSVLAYIVPLTLMTILSPVFPDFDWFYQGIIGIIFPIIVFVQINYINLKLDKTITKRRKRKQSPVTKIPVFALLIVFILFMGGFLKYYPITILSESMLPKIEIGDAVIIEKIGNNNLKKVKKYDIIAYRIDKRVVVHRIISINKDNKYVITKGDNNNTADSENVKENQIIGIVKFKIPKIGMPAVWLNKLLNS